MQALTERLEHPIAIVGRRADAPDGLVWITSGTLSAASLALQRTLREALKKTQAYWGVLPDHATPSLVVYCSNGEINEKKVAELMVDLKRVAPQAAIVVLSESASLRLARAALRAGARGLLHSGMPPEQIARALSVAERGEVVLPRDLLKAAEAEERRPDLSALTQRQLEVLELVAAGLTNAQIARQLWLSESTVKQHLRAAYKLLEVKNRAEAAATFRHSNPQGRA